MLWDRDFAARAAAQERYLRALDEVAKGHAMLKERASRLSQQETARRTRAAQERLLRTAGPLPRALAGPLGVAPCPGPPHLGTVTSSTSPGAR